MADNISESKHLASLDFDISTIAPQMQEIKRIVKETGLTLKQVVDSNFNIGEAVNRQIQSSANAFKKTEINVQNSVNRIGTSVKTAVQRMVKDGDPTALLAQYLRQGSKKIAVSWTSNLESEFSKRIPDLKKSLSSYISWDYTGTAPGIDTYQKELENMGLITKGMMSQADIMEDIYNRINQFRNTRNSIVSGDVYDDEVNSLNKYKFALNETEEELRDFLNAQNLSRKELQDFTGSQLGNLGSNDLKARISQIREAVGMEEQLRISTDAEGKIRSAIVEYTDQQGRKIKETINLASKLNKETGQMEIKIKDTNFDYIDQSLKRANDELKTLQANFKVYSDLKKQSETKSMLPQEEAIIQERLAKASKDYQDSLMKVAQYTNQGLISEQQYVNLTIKDKALQDDITIAKEKQAQADDKKYQSIVQQFDKQQSLLQQQLATAANTVQKSGLGEQYLVDIRKIQVEVEKLGRESGVITQDEITRLNILKEQALEILTQTKHAKSNKDILKKQAQDEKAILSIYERSAKLQSQIKAYKATGNTALSKETKLIKEQAEQIFKKLSTEGKISDEMREQTAELQKQLNLIETQAKVNISNNPKVNNKGMLSEIASKAKWYIAGSTAFAGGYVAKQALQTLTQVEYKVMEITRVMNDSTLDAKSFQEELFNLAVSYGRSFDDVSEVALRFAQAGYNVKETLTMTKESLLALNTAELDVQNSTQSMIGIMQQWDYSATQLNTIIDKINYTADNNAITSQDLVDGLLQAGSAAKTAKISFDDTIGTLVAMKEASGRTGREVGNALKSIIAYTQRDKSFNTFESLGIEVFADKANGVLRPALELIGDLSAKWKQNGEVVVDTLLKDEGAAELLNESMAELIGSTEEYTAVKEAESNANDKSLSDMERLDAVQTAGMHRRTYFISLLENFNKIQQVSNDLQNSEGYSLTENAKHMDTLKTKVTQLIESLKQLAIQTGEAGMLDIAKDTIDATTALTKFIECTGGLQTALTLVLGVIIALKREKIASDIKELGTNVKGLITNFNSLKTSAISTSGAISTVGVSLQAVLGFVGLATIAITAVTGVISAANKKAEESRQAIIETGFAANEAVKSITELKQKYDDLSNVSSKTTEQEEEFKKVQKELIELLGDKAKALDEAGLSADEYRKKLAELTKEELKNQRANLASAQYETESKVKDLSKGFLGLSKTPVELGNSKTFSQYKDIFNNHLSQYAINGVANYKMPQNDIKSIVQYYKDMQAVLQELKKIGVIDSSIFKTEEYKQVNDEVTRLTPALTEYFEIDSKIADITEIQNKSLAERAQKTRNLSDIVSSNKSQMQSMNKAIDDTQAELKELADLHDLVAHNEQISGSQILDLIQKYPQYAAEIANVNNNKQAMIDITKTLFELKKKYAISELEQDKQKLTDNLALINSEKRVAQAKILSMRVSSMSNEDTLRQLHELETQINKFDAESLNAANDIYAIDTAIKSIDNLDISTFSKKGVSANAKDTKDALKEEKDLIKEQTDTINDQITAIEHLGETGAYSIEKQISLYKELLRTSATTAEIQQKLEKNIFNLYKKQIDEKIKLAEKEKKEKIQAIKDSADSEIKALERIKSERESERNEDDYNSERSDIKEEISYWEQRTGQEATTNIKRLKEQLAELDKNRQRDLEDEQLQEQIKYLENKRDNEVRYVEETWEEVQTLFDSENLEMVDKAKEFSTNIFYEYDVNFLNPYLEKILRIKDAMQELAAEELERAERAKYPKATPQWGVPVKHAYASGTSYAHGGLSLVGEQGPELRILNQGDGIIPTKIANNLMELGQYSLNDMFSKFAEEESKRPYILSPQLQNQLNRDMQRIQQNYSTSTNNYYNNDNRGGSPIIIHHDEKYEINNNNRNEDMADVQAIFNTLSRQLIGKIRTLPH